jgi:hypothetical protein
MSVLRFIYTKLPFPWRQRLIRAGAAAAAIWPWVRSMACGGLNFLRARPAFCALCGFMIAAMPSAAYYAVVIAPAHCWPFGDRAADTLRPRPRFSPDDLVSDTIADDDSVASLRLQEAYCQATLEQSQSDSIAVIIDLPDSTAVMAVRGCPISASRIMRYGLSPEFSLIRARGTMSAWICRPAIVQRAWATIKKIPIKVKRAPKDSIEAGRAADDIPEPLPKQDTYFTLECDRNLTVHVRQQGFPGIAGLFSALGYFARMSIDRGCARMASIACIRTPAAAVNLQLILSRDDATCMYRALPAHASIVLRPPR